MGSKVELARGIEWEKNQCTRISQNISAKNKEGLWKENGDQRIWCWRYGSSRECFQHYYKRWT